MSDQLTESQVARVVAEVTRQAQLRDHEQRQTLEREQVVQILDELKLPVELLDPAMVELERREAEAAVQARYDEALAKKRRRTFLLVGSVVAVLLVVVLFFGGMWELGRRELAAVTAIDGGRITHSGEGGENLGVVSRNGGEIFYRVTLEKVPLSKNLSMKCNWIDPGGRVVKQNSWETRTTDKSVWATSCRTTLGPSDAPGAWTVEMLLGDRVVSKTGFKVE
jgi:hypothetical protein